MNHDENELIPPPQQWRDPRNLRIDRRGDVVVTERSMYRPGQVLLTTSAREALVDVLVDELAAQVDESAGLAAIGVERWLLGVETDPLDVVAQLTATLGPAADDPEVAVSVNYVLTGEPKYRGGPGGAPEPIDAGWEAEPPDRRDSPDIAVLDTGVPVSMRTWHPGLADCLDRDADDTDELYLKGTADELLGEAGHGTFIAGLVARLAPGLLIDPGEVLDPDGLGDDVSVTAELLETSAGVVNLSLGGYTEDDRPPLALTRAIRSIRADDPGRVVVAAAGNNGSPRPFWPAALPEVVAVGAGDVDSGGRTARAGFSNHGDWVDVWTYGVGVVSTYVLGRYPVGQGRTHDFGSPFAAWDGTSFAAPVVAAGIAAVAVADGVSPADAWDRISGGLGDPGIGLWYEPPTDPRRF